MQLLAEHRRAPRFDEIEGDAIQGTAGGACGDTAVILLQPAADGTIAAVGVRVRGREVVGAVLSWMAEEIRGRDPVDAAGVGLTRVWDDLGLADDEHERARIAEDAMHHALGNAVLARAAGQWPAGTELPERDLVAMSGGVDSAVALHDTLDGTGSGAVGATLRLWIDPRAPDPDSACCAPDSVRRARATCHAAGAPHLSLDLRDAFSRKVVAPFVAAYAAGATPNPCVGCNGSFRLDELIRVADAAGCDHVVTGHYVRRADVDGVPVIQAGVDLGKDQSYMLATVAPATTARYRFPLGAQDKSATRVRATQLGLEQARAPDSQEVCFLGGGDYRGFLRERGALGKTGDIVGPDGSVLGSHDGLARFTPGQRRGIGVQIDGGSEPLYVTDVESTTGNVRVGPRADLLRQQVHVGGARWHVPPRTDVYVRLRYRAQSQPAAVTDHGDGTWTITMAEPARAPARGQIACLYDADGRVLGAGTIRQSS